MPIPVIPAIPPAVGTALDVGLTVLEAATAFTRDQHRQKEELLRQTNREAQQRRLPMPMNPMLPVPVPNGVHTLPSRSTGRFARDSNGEILFFALDPRGESGTLVELPPNTSSFRKQLERQGINLFVFDNMRQQFVDYKPRRRRMNPLNFRALKRASRRVEAFEKVIKKHFSVGQPKKKRIKRKKKRR